MLRLIADDLSGAIDSAAPFAAVRGALPVVWQEAARRCSDRDLAIDSETRDDDARQAMERVRELSPLLEHAAIAFKKIDSCLRGQPAAEIAAATRAGGFRSTVVAPAFPLQGRVTRDGRQWVRTSNDWVDSGVDLMAELGAFGFTVGRTSAPLGAGLFFCDAEDDADLQRIAACGRQLDAPTLWCGSGGLARALAGPAPAIEVVDAVHAPVLVLIGTDHATTRAQLAALGTAPVDALRIASIGLPPGASRSAAETALARMLGDVAAGPPPATLIVAGGETLLRLCKALGAQRLEVMGEVEPGVPLSRMADGDWAGTRVVSKSGGFGDPLLLCRLVAEVPNGPANG